jgi:GT2 family glycosyltransferase
MPITVAIVNYNGQEYLHRLLLQVHAQGFTHVVVLDDASTDGTHEWLAAQPGIMAVTGAENLGPVGNRNRILDVPTEDIILFLDNDMELLTAKSAAVLEAEFSRHPEAAVVGALMVDHWDKPVRFNWGYSAGPYRLGQEDVLNQIACAHGNDPQVMATVRRIARGVAGHLEPIESREVGWVAEGFFAVRDSVFRALGGFDPAFRMFEESPDFCLRARRAGHKVRFSTNVRVRHLDQQSGTKDQRDADRTASSRYYFRKHYGIADEELWHHLRWE